MNQKQLLDNYAESLLAEIGVDDDLSKDVRGQMKLDILERLNNYFLAKSLEKLSEEKINHINNEIKNGKEDGDIWEEIKKSIPNFDAFSLEILKEFRKIYLGRE